MLSMSATCTVGYLTIIRARHLKFVIIKPSHIHRLIYYMVNASCIITKGVLGVKGIRVYYNDKAKPAGTC